jgi:hypothetical protein
MPRHRRNVELMRIITPPRARITPSLVASLAMSTTLTLWAAPGCQEQLAKVDAELAAANDLDPQMRTVLKSMRDRGAQHCTAGRTSSASAALQSVELILQSTTQAAAQKQATAVKDKASRTQLTPEYLKGTWCATQKQNNERGLWVFSDDGSYRVGPASFNYALVSEGDLNKFWQTYHAVRSKEPDRFVVTRYQYVTTFERGQGACQPTASGR